MIRKQIKKKNLFEEKNFNTLSRFFLCSFLIISIFYITPIFITFSKKNLNNKEFTNNSKKILAYTLNTSTEKNNQSQNINEEDLLFDIFI